MSRITEQQPEYYDIIPEYNSAGRLCNYHAGDGETVRVPADEWERFNRLAGRQHEVVDGVVVYNAELESCLPDDAEVSDPQTDTDVMLVDIAYRLTLLEMGAM